MPFWWRRRHLAGSVLQVDEGVERAPSNTKDQDGPIRVVTSDVALRQAIAQLISEVLVTRTSVYLQEIRRVWPWS
jgi:hypothetical protein